MDLNLTGRKALVTGGSKGIGRACAEILASEGCSLHLVAREETNLRQTQEVIESQYGVEVTIHPVDLSRSGEITALAATCSDIDILVNNAGAIPRGDLWEVDEHRWREAWDLKVFGYINLCRAIYPQMRSREKGVIINVIGMAGERPRIEYIAGGSGNASLMAFTRALGARSLQDGIRVVGVNPGLIQTERLLKILKDGAQRRFNDPERWKELMPSDPTPGDPGDIAGLVVFLASDRAKYITGTVITADGGSSAG